MNSQPKAYREGWIEFYKLRFTVNPDVLIPRPETETLVETVINYCQQNNFSNPRIVDVGTGSGCIAISLAVNLPQSRIIATDISERSLAVAGKNSAFHRVEHRITYIKTDLITGIAQELF